MQIVTTHVGTDFDALASVVACTFLYPGAVGVLPRMVNPEVKQFLAIHANILRVKPRKGFDLDEVTSLIVVDANNWKRLDKMDALSGRDDVEVICWDHHMEGVTIESGETHREEVGAAVTLLLEEMQKRDTAISPMHATLFLLGIYSDTGCLRYPSVTSRDAAMVSYLIENGADLNVVSAYLDDSMDDAHTEVFGRILEESEVVRIGNIRAGICALQIKSGLTSLAPLVEKYRAFKGIDAAFGVFQADSQKCMVIGRGKPQFIDIGRIMRALGGGGHLGAGSAIIREAGPDEAVEQVKSLIARGCHETSEVKAIMSPPDLFVVDAGATMAQAACQLADNNISGLLVCQDDVLLGGLSMPDCTKAKKSGRSDVPVKGYVTRKIPKLDPTACCRDAISLMADAKEGILAVVEGDELVGVVTQTDLLFQVYEF
ncbi:CBS domain-containing protein [uncultured Pseudodesulfovibrio sp.]|uniref:CBS domain-containing protein n=1 Tax=uncultured Pseudodesulfovibrio sp. TaxID=2035858 RepID=UPI0029C7EBD4|nr:CBS domain-containing protein [uncultured Pseudodesulfovibrio sp.]